MTFEPTSEPFRDLPPDRLPTTDDLHSDPVPPSFGAPAVDDADADDFASDDAAAPLGAPNPTQEPSALAPPPPHDAAYSGLPLSPADAARDNARGGHWAMSEWYDGWVFLGADGRPVVRNDGSRIGFRFADAARLAQELAATPDEETADGSGRRALAPLDSRFNKDWDPQRPKSTLADMTKWTRLLAYHLVQSTEPEEAVRRAVSMIFGKPVTMDERGEKLWVPTKYDAEVVKAVAGALLRQAVGPEVVESDDQNPDAVEVAPAAEASPTTRTIRGVPLDGRGLGSSLTRVAATPNNSTMGTGNQKAGTTASNVPMAPPGVDLDANIAEAWKRRGDPTWFYDQVRNKGPWDYKQQGKDKYQDFGNFHYGATGAAMGFSEATLLRMAGWAQIQSSNKGSGTSPGLLLSFLGVGGVAPYRDDPVDQYWVSRGYQYYHQNKQRWELPPPPTKLRGARKP